MKSIFHYSLLAAGLISAATLTGCKSSKKTAEKTVEKTPEKQVVVKTQDKSIVILYENDVHCAIDNYAKLAGLRDAVSDTAYAAIVSSGDFLQGGTAGAISKGKYIVDIMKSVEYDAVTLGNHEFDYKVPQMISLLNYLAAPVTCVNLKDKKTGRNVYVPFVLRKYGVKTVAFIGVTTPTARYTEEYAFLDKDGNETYELSEKNVYELLQNAVDKARSLGANYVIVLSHVGEDDNNTHIESHGMIANTVGIDAVLDGHTHSVVPTQYVPNKAGVNVLISQTGTKLANVGKLCIDKNGFITNELVPITAINKENATVRHTTDSIKALAQNFTSKHVGTSDYKLRILDDKGNQQIRMAETNAGDLVADAFRIIVGSNIGMTNGGGVRSEVNAGELKMGDIIDLLPYDNYLYEVEVEGSTIALLLTKCIQNLPLEDGDFPQVSGIKFDINAAAHQVSNIKILNPTTNQYEPIKMNGLYTIATTDYCITGGGFRGVLKDSKVTKTGLMIYSEALVEYISNNLNGHIGKEYAEPQGRINFIKK
ncbi:MAG: bifunctional metallophosphatase/5'-nucleotidase [Paludibacteraceae bacterium]|nr:bifunctional metallophosphatase/5'-nucleotidase [Paludibacteraceae bacterium]